MLVVEPIIHKVSGHSHHGTQHTPLPTSDPGPSSSDAASGSNGHVEFDVELGELEREQGIEVGGAASKSSMPHHIEQLNSDTATVAYPLTLGLMVHALADGFALGSSALSPVDNSLSLIVFLALIIHKGAIVPLLSRLSTCSPAAEQRPSYWRYQRLSSLPPSPAPNVGNISLCSARRRLWARCSLMHCYPLCGSIARATGQAG